MNRKIEKQQSIISLTMRNVKSKFRCIDMTVKKFPILACFLELLNQGL